MRSTITSDPLLEQVGNYVKDLDLGYQVSYGIPLVERWGGSFIRGVPNGDHTFPEVYKIPVHLKDSDRSWLGVDFYVDSTGKLERRPPSKKYIQDAMAGRKQHYVVLVIRDGEAARRLAEQLYSNDDVVGLEMGRRTALDELYDTSESHHGLGPEIARVKPEERSIAPGRFTAHLSVSEFRGKT